MFIKAERNIPALPSAAFDASTRSAQVRYIGTEDVDDCVPSVSVGG